MPLAASVLLLLRLPCTLAVAQQVVANLPKGRHLAPTAAHNTSAVTVTGATACAELPNLPNVSVTCTMYRLQVLDSLQKLHSPKSLCDKM